MSGTHDAHAHLVSRLEEQAQDIQRLVSGLDEDALATRLIPNKWSLKELVCHLWRVQEVFESRIEAMLTQSDPLISPYEPDGDPEFDQKLKSTAAELVQGFLTERDQLATLLQSLSPADWHRPGCHPEFPYYDVHFQVEMMVWHEAHHLYQILQRRAPLGRIPH